MSEFLTRPLEIEIKRVWQVWSIRVYNIVIELVITIHVILESVSNISQTKTRNKKEFTRLRNSRNKHHHFRLNKYGYFLYVLSLRFSIPDFTLILGDYGENHVKTKSVLEKNLFDRIFWTCVFSVILIIGFVIIASVSSPKRIPFGAIESKGMPFILTWETFEPILCGNLSNFEWVSDKTSRDWNQKGLTSMVHKSL